MTSLVLRRLGRALTAWRGLWVLSILLALVGESAWAAQAPRGEDDCRVGWRAWAARKHEEALAALGRAVQASRGIPDYRESLGYMQYMRGKQRDAESTLNRAARQAPKEPRIPYLLAQMYGLRYAGDPEHDQEARQQTLKSYQRAITLDPENGFPQAQYASVLFDSGHDEKAINALDAAIAAESFRLYLLPTPPPREPGEDVIFWAVSLDLLTPAMARFNNIVSRCRRRAAVARAAGDTEQAKADFTRAAALSRRVAAMEPKLLTSALFGLRMDSRAQRSLAEILRASGDAAAAEEAVVRADSLESVVKDTEAEARTWAEQATPSAQDMRERETKLVEKALRLAYP